LGLQHPVLVEQGQAALRLQNALDHEHHVGRPASYSSKTMAMGAAAPRGSMPSRNSVTCLPSRRTMASLADEVDAADVAVEVHAHQRPVQPGGDLLDVRRLAGAVIALDHHAAVVGEAGADGQRGLRVEAVGLVDLRHVRVGRGEGGDQHVAVHAEGLAHGDLAVRAGAHQRIVQRVLGGGGVSVEHGGGSCTQRAPGGRGSCGDAAPDVGTRRLVRPWGDSDQKRKGRPMRFMVQVRATRDTEAGVMPTTELMQAMMNFNEEMVNAGVMKTGDGLHPTSHNAARLTFEGPDAPLVTDGPFTETKELIAGFWIIETASFEEAVNWMRRPPWRPATCWRSASSSTPPTSARR
jgi:hypothetical protein